MNLLIIVFITFSVAGQSQKADLNLCCFNYITLKKTSTQYEKLAIL